MKIYFLVVTEINGMALINRCSLKALKTINSFTDRNLI